MWLESTIKVIPALLWVFIGMGVPYALIVLPRRDWADRVMVACLSLGFGPALLTAWMFVLGILGQNDDPNAGLSNNPMQTTIINHVGGESLLRPELILGGTVVIAIIGMFFAWRKRNTNTDTTGAYVDAPLQTPLYIDEKLLIGLIIIATILRWVLSAWLEFGAYDPLWVYGYQAKIYTLTGYIPADIGYYPQFIPLQYAFGQIVMGGINDHAARAVIPFLQVGSILATYILGSRLFNSRRVGIVAASLWALYPHFGYWTRVADLEIPVTFAFTGAAAFFLMAWTNDEKFFRRRYALIAGLFLGIAMWTKPTAGAFIWGVIALVTVDFVRVRGDWRQWMPRFEVAFITGLASIPLGSVWYIRNIIIGHDAIVMPDSFWLTQAMRSGTEFGWPLLALLILLAYLMVDTRSFHETPLHKKRPNILGVIIGLLLVLAGIVPTICEPARMQGLEWLSLFAGLFILALTLAYYAVMTLNKTGIRNVTIVGWAYLLALPYFVTWFYSYSYHYRLSFPIVPLMLLPTAFILANWFTMERVSTWKPYLRVVYLGVIMLLSLQAVFIVLYDEGRGWDWLWTEPTEDEESGFVATVDFFEDYANTHDEAPVIIAPSLRILPFYFPEWDIRVTETPTEYNQVEGATHFIDTAQGRLLYQEKLGGNPFHSPFFAGLWRDNVATKVADFIDINEHYVIYNIHPQQRFEYLDEPDIIPDGDVVFGDMIRLKGYSYNTDTFHSFDVPVETYFLWEVLEPIADDYILFFHLISEDDPTHVWDNEDGAVNRPYKWELNYYSTLFWEPGEFIIDRRGFYLNRIEDTPAGALL